MNNIWKNFVLCGVFVSCWTLQKTGVRAVGVFLPRRFKGKEGEAVAQVGKCWPKEKGSNRTSP